LLLIALNNTILVAHPIAHPTQKKEETIARFPLDFAYITCRSIFPAGLQMPCRVLLRHENP